MKEFGMSVIYVAFWGIVAQLIGPLLPRKWFDAQRFPYAAFEFEEDGKIYSAMRVQKWKKKLPDISRFSKRMRPKRISTMSSKDIDALVAETCVAEFVHVALSVLSFAVLRFWKNRYGVIFVALYILVGNVPYIIIQRYNRPQLIRVAGRLRRRECGISGEGTHTVMQHGRGA